MKLSSLCLAVTACAQLASSWSSGQVIAQYKNQGPPIVLTDQEQVLNYWTSEGGWHSELQLRNNLPAADLTVTPVIRSSSGEETALPPVTIKPQEVRSINLSAAIDANAPQLSGLYGSVLLRYHAEASRNLYAAMMVHDTGHPIAFHIDASGESDVFESGSREGVWWLPSEATKDILVLTNQGKQRMEVNLTLYDALGKQTSQILPLGPRETARYSIRQFIKSGGLTGEYGGIHVQALTHGGSLDTLHAIYDENAGFSALLKMFDRDPKAKIEERDFNHTAAWTLRAPMLALSNPDTALNFPADTILHPEIFVRNTSAKRVVANLRFNWRRQDATGSAKGPNLTLAPFETKRIDVAQLQDGVTLPKDANWAAVTLTTNSLPDEVLAVAASFDSTLRYGAQTPFSDQLSSIWKGGQFEYDTMHNSLITAGNGGSRPIQSAFTIFYNQGQQKYELEQKLEPDQQMWIDIGKLVRNQVPDKTGKTLPSDLATGSYEFRDLTNRAVGSLYEGKVIYDKSYGHVAYGCAACCAITGVYLFYDPFYNPVGPGFTNGVDGNDDCGDRGVDLSDGFYNWNTANHAIATTTVYGTHTGVAVGATTSSTSGQITHTNGRNGCYEIPSTPSGPTNVASLSCTSTVTRGASATCTVTGPSGTSVSGWKFTDSSSNVVNRSTSTTSLTWSGKMVTSGTVSVSAGEIQLSASITVTNRTNFAFTSVSPTSESNGFSGDGCPISVASPPTANGDFVGKFCLQQVATPTTQQIVDNGPNTGFSYVSSIINSSGSLTTGYFYVVSPDLQNSTSTFYTAQCGNYNAQTTPNGFISGVNLLANTIRHESGTVQSHYENYVLAQNDPGNNLGIAAEPQVGLVSAQDLANTVANTLSSKRQTILSAAQVEPCSVQQNASCVFQGAVNLLPYQLCN